MSYAALRAANLDWMVGPGYSWGRYILNVLLRASGTQLVMIFVTARRSQLTGSDDFPLLTGDPNWLEVMFFVTDGGSQLTGSDDFCYWRGIPTDLWDV